jgi:hypothetical protein
MIKKASGKTRTSTKKKTSAKRRTGTRVVAKGQATATTKGVIGTRTTTKKRAPAKKGASVRRGPAPKAISPALDLEELFSTTQSKLVVAWQKEADAAVKALEGLQKKLDGAGERQRKAKDKRVAATIRDKEKHSAATGARLEKAKQAYTEATAVVVELRDLMTAARTRMKAAKLALARTLARDRVLTRFAKDYGKAQAAKTQGTRGKPRKSAQRVVEQIESPTDESVPSPSGADETEDESTPGEVENT